MKVLLHGINYGNIKCLCGFKCIENQEEQKKMCTVSRKLADKEQLVSGEYFAQSSSVGRCLPGRD